MGYERTIAGIFVGVGAIALIVKGEISGGVAILAGMMGFFIGEKNGAKKVAVT